MLSNEQISEEYAKVASHPEKGFHFHTGRPLARILEYADEWLRGIPESSIESFAGTGNPFSLAVLRAGERVVDVGCSAGIDSLIAAKQVGPDGRVIGVDMTPYMLEKARRAAVEMGLENVEFKEGYGAALPVEDGWAEVVISNGVLNLCRIRLPRLRRSPGCSSQTAGCRSGTSWCRRLFPRAPNARLISGPGE
jgi:arsenite methyltransferase